jgi:hypothetical protein
MSLQLSDKTKISLGEFVFDHLEGIAASHGISDRFLKLFRIEMSGKLARLSHCIFECVHLPAFGTNRYTIAVRINPAFDTYVTMTAQKWSILQHGACLHRQRRLDHGIRICDENRASDSVPATAPTKRGLR